MKSSRGASALFLKLAAAAAVAVVTAKAADILLGRYFYEVLPGNLVMGPRDSLLTYDLFPYDGWHIQSNFRQRGDMPWEARPRRDYDVRSGPMGFFMDFDPDNPPKKQPREYRIILIGGSGAQGFGALTNDHMLYRRLEKRLNDALHGSVSVRVIDMAMAGSISYQNFIALNRWGHALEPDMILSYSGFNDYEIPLSMKSDAHADFDGLEAWVLACRGGEFPAGLGWLAGLLPNIMTRTNLGVGLKVLLSYRHFLERGREVYRARRGISYSSNPELFDKVAVPLYIHAMKSIKRDFQGIPVMIAWQAAPDRTPPSGLPATYYDDMFETAKKSLKGYINGDWLFLNVNAAFENNPPPYIGIHLEDKGQDVVAGLIAERILPLIKRRGAR